MINDVLSFLKSLTLIDYVFFFTVLFLLILVVCLIYFVIINKDAANIKTLDLNDPMDLKKLANSIVVDKEPIEFTSYEEEQEKKAIISYDELLSKTDNGSINYVDENTNDSLVKRVNLQDLIKPAVNVEVAEEEHENKAISLEKEEDFLKALNELKENLS